MNTRVVIMLALIALVAMYMLMTAARPVRAQADADQKSIPGFSITSADVFAA